jgi:hypothetical protein
MARVLIIPDVHTRCAQADAIVSWEKCDRVIWLGDTWDQWGDSPEIAAATARWFKEKLADPRNVMLLGNHDQALRWCGNGFAFCSGFTEAKSHAVRKILTQADFEKLLPFYVEQDILFTHAGLDEYWLSWAAAHGYAMPDAATLSDIMSWLTEIWPAVQEKYDEGSCHPLLEAGQDRGGVQRVGGFTWADFSNHRVIRGIRQICGHTIHLHVKGPLMRFKGAAGGKSSPVAKYVKDGVKPEWMERGWSLCLDTDLRHYLVIEDRRCTVKSVVWTRPRGQNDFQVRPGSVISSFDL